MNHQSAVRQQTIITSGNDGAPVDVTMTLMGPPEKARATSDAVQAHLSAAARIEAALVAVTTAARAAGRLHPDQSSSFEYQEARRQLLAALTAVRSARMDLDEFIDGG